MMLLGQEMDGVSSAAVSLVVPAGASFDDQPGAGAVTAEWILRGAGDRDSRQLSDAFDALGSHYESEARSEHLIVTASQLGRNLPEVLQLLADVICRPRLSDETFASCLGLIRQDLAALEDEPARKCNMYLREKFYPWPLGRCIYGDEESLESMKADDVRRHVAQRFVPEGTMLTVAGNIKWEAFRTEASKLFGDWSATPAPTREVQTRQGGVTHIEKDSAQTHIAMAHPAVTMDDPQYFAARLGARVLSGGMSSRLFTEVREKRGLVYHVSTRYHGLKGHAGMFTYAGTTPEKAQETFDVTLGELRRLSQGIDEEEMDRARTQLKAALVMQGESTESRSGALASDWYHIGRLRSLQELSEAIDAVTVDDVLQYLKGHPPANFTILVIGPKCPDVSAASE
jgi:predicted Zn-dependent peptidase